MSFSDKVFFGLFIPLIIVNGLIPDRYFWIKNICFIGMILLTAWACWPDKKQGTKIPCDMSKGLPQCGVTFENGGMIHYKHCTNCQCKS